MKRNQTITNFLPNSGAYFFTTNRVGLRATATSGLTVIFTNASGPGSILGTNLTFTGTGTVVVVASQAGNATWNPAPKVTNMFSVTKATAVVTLNGLSQTFNGAPRKVTATTVPSGLSVLSTYDGATTPPSTWAGTRSPAQSTP